MTASPSPRRQPKSEPRRQPKHKLTVIDAEKLRREFRRRRVAMFAVVSLAAVFFVVAIVQAQLVQSQHSLDQTRADTAALEEQIAILEREVMAASSPVAIVDAAETLGMVRAQDPVYLVSDRRGG